MNFKDAVFGTKKIIKLRKDVECEKCHGSGAKNSSSVTTCHNCGDSGVETYVQSTVFGQVQSQRECTNCHGTGKIIKDKCAHCFGK